MELIVIMSFQNHNMALMEVGNLRRKILMISLLVTLLLLPLVVTAGKKPDKPGRPSGSSLTLSGEVIGDELYSPNRPTFRTIEADGTVTFDSAEFGNLKSTYQQGKLLSFIGEHVGHLRIDYSPRRDTAYFRFVCSEYIDEDGFADHVLLHSLAAGVGIVETYGTDHVSIEFVGDLFELWVAYKDEDGAYLGGDGWLIHLTITIDIYKT